ncbi:MAG: putative esterase [Myxococcaceae bacterium]|nr:putative esterase [Myxococcaceae bacterium]
MKVYRAPLSLLAGCLILSCGTPQVVPPPPPEKVPTTYRILAGVSMGGIGTAALGFSRPERFDGVAVQGGPIDAAFFFRMLDKFTLGGFCSRAELEKILAADPLKLNDPDAIAACRVPTPTLKWEHQQDFNHWHYTTNGANFSRESYGNMISDLTLGFGNLFTENPASPYAPPGVDAARMKKPPADFCTNPVKVKNLRNFEYNPDGKYDAITFCDGQPRLFFCRNTQTPVDFCSDPANKRVPLPIAQEKAFADAFCLTQGGVVEANKNDHPLYMLNHAGASDPCREAIGPMTVGLAYDYNANGRRDYGEPTVNNPWERFDDFGLDGCPDALEDGKGGCTTTANAAAVDPNHDNYEVDANALGTENDWLWQQGEPYRDHGLDGVPGTSDLGEGNGKYDLISGRQMMLKYDARTNFRALDEKQKKRFNVMVDGGIRDVFNLGVMAQHLFGLVKAVRTTATGQYRDFLGIPGMVNTRTGNFAPWNNRWKLIPHDLSLLYGKEAPTDEDRVAGEGDHVGTIEQAVNRFYVMFNWAAATWPNLERPLTPFGGASASERQKITWFDSKLLKAKREYAIALPPGYDLPENKDKRYPVLFMLHGYGMDPKGFLGTSLITDSYVTDKDVNFRPIIQVFPSGRCCFVNQTTGAKDCRETDDTGRDIDRLAGWERECHSGSFYVNRRGYTPDDVSLYGDAFFELMDHVDQTYRTQPAAEVEAR